MKNIGKLLIVLITSVSLLMLSVASFASEPEYVFEEPAFIEDKASPTENTDTVFDEEAVFAETVTEDSAFFEEEMSSSEDVVNESPAFFEEEISSDEDMVSESAEEEAMSVEVATDPLSFTEELNEELLYDDEIVDESYSVSGSEEYGKTSLLGLTNGLALASFYDTVKSDIENFGLGNEDVSDTLEIVSYTSTNTGLTGGEIAEVCATVLLDHPEFFWTSNNLITEYTDGAIISTWAECATPDGREQIASTIEMNLGNLISAVIELSEGDVVSKVKAAHDLIILSTTYNEEASMNSSIAGVLYSQNAVCLSYSSTLKYLLNQLGIDCLVATGIFLPDEHHAWNYVKDEEGSYFLVDITKDDWDDQSYSIFNSDLTSIRTQYEYLSEEHLIDNTYFMLDYAVFSQDHIPNTPQQSGLDFLYEVPEVDSDLYYIEDADVSISDDTTQYELFDMITPLIRDALLAGHTWVGFSLDADRYGFVNTAIEKATFNYYEQTPIIDLCMQEYPEVAEIYAGMKADNRYINGNVYLTIKSYKDSDAIEKPVHVYIDDSYHDDYVTIAQALSSCTNLNCADLELRLEPRKNYYYPNSVSVGGGINLLSFSNTSYVDGYAGVCLKDDVYLTCNTNVTHVEFLPLPGFDIHMGSHEMSLLESSIIGVINFNEYNEDNGYAANCFVTGDSGSQITIDGDVIEFYCSVDVDHINLIAGDVNFRGANVNVNVDNFDVRTSDKSHNINIGMIERADSVTAVIDNVNLYDEHLNINPLMRNQELIINNIENKGKLERNIGFLFSKITEMIGADDSFSMSDITINSEYIPQNDYLLQFQLNTGESLDDVGDWIPADFRLMKAPYLNTDTAFITVNLQQMDDDFSWIESRSLIFNTKKDSDGYILRGNNISLFWIDDFYVTRQANGDYSLVMTKNANNLKIPAELNGVPVTELGAYHPWYYKLYPSPANDNISGTVIIPSSFERLIWYRFAQDSPTIFLGDKPEFDWDHITFRESDADIFYLSRYADSWDADGELAEMIRNKGANLYEVDVDDVLTFSEDITSIAANEYQNSIEKSLKIGASVTTIGNNAFDGSSFTTAYIPSTVTSISDTAFSNCGDISFFTDATYSYALEWARKNNKRCYVIPQDKVVDGVWTVQPNGSTSCTITGYKGTDTSVTIPDKIGGYTVTEIGEGALEDHSEIEQITIPEHVEYIGRRAFRCCSHLTDISIPDSVKNIDDNAFGECSNLESIIIPDSVISIGEFEFQGCQSLKAVKLGDDVEVIGRLAFSGCWQLESINIPDSLTVLQEGVFAGCESLGDIVLPESLEEIQDYAFERCSGYYSGIKSITIPRNVSEIGDDAFSECKGDVIIYCYRDSYADIWMQNNSSFSIVYLDDEISTDAPEFTTHALVLSGEIGVKFRVVFPEGFDPIGCYIAFETSDGRRGKILYTDAKNISDSTDKWFIFYINALELSDQITATLHYGNGQTVTNQYSAMDYINAVNNNSEIDQRLVSLVNALHEYGFYLQGSGWTDGKTHTTIPEPVKELSDDEIETAKSGVANMGIVKDLNTSDIGSVMLSLTLNAQTRINISVKPNNGAVMISDGCKPVTIGGKTYYQFKTDYIGAGNLGVFYDIGVETDKGTATISASPMSYVKSVLNSSSLSMEKKLAMTAFYDYYVAAQNYLS